MRHFLLRRQGQKSKLRVVAPARLIRCELLGITPRRDFAIVKGGAHMVPLRLALLKMIVDVARLATARGGGVH